MPLFSGIVDLIDFVIRITLKFQPVFFRYLRAYLSVFDFQDPHKKTAYPIFKLVQAVQYKMLSLFLALRHQYAVNHMNDTVRSL